MDRGRLKVVARQQESRRCQRGCDGLAFRDRKCKIDWVSWVSASLFPQTVQIVIRACRSRLGVVTPFGKVGGWLLISLAVVIGSE
ncbi:hypothetical protein L6452_21338 [Arctium lappa]|uniref:Uncharacterized protein n=1 Tax=Arctium lappa TaxID=4217 RepID=A0ACB9BDF1_ARCLA|nr:hypothetical protein L6452_21338 [Arctium lappa]